MPMVPFDAPRPNPFNINSGNKPIRQISFEGDAVPLSGNTDSNPRILPSPAGIDSRRIRALQGGTGDQTPISSSPLEKPHNPEIPPGTTTESSGIYGIEWTYLRDRAPLLYARIQQPQAQSARNDQDTVAPSEPSSGEETLRPSYDLILPYKNPQRFGHGHTAIVIPSVTVMPLSYEALEIALTQGNFQEYNETHPVVRFPKTEEGRTVVSSHGDFQRVADTTRETISDAFILFPGTNVEELYAFNQSIGWGNFVICSKEEVADEQQRVFTLVDVEIDLFSILQQYSLDRIARNPYAPYLPTEDNQQ